MTTAYRPGVGIMLINRHGLVFAGMRLDTPGAWQMPQGGIDPDESPQEAAVRELREEIGTDKVRFIAESADWYTYELPHDIAVELWDGRYTGQKQKWFIAEFLGQDSDINLDTEHPEFQRWRWSTTEELVDDIVDFKVALYKAVLAEFMPIISQYHFHKLHDDIA